MELREALRRLSDATMMQNFAKASPNFGGGRLEDGEYICKIVNMDFGESQNKRFQLHWVFTVVDGPERGQEIHKYDGLETEQNWGYVKANFETVGIKYQADDSRSILKGCVEFVQGAQNDHFKLRLRTGQQGFQNVHIQGYVDYKAASDVQMPDDSQFLPGDGSAGPSQQPGQYEFDENAGVPADGLDPNFLPQEAQPQEQPKRGRPPAQPQAQPQGGGKRQLQQRQTTKR